MFFDALIKTVAIPAIESAFGISATHTDSEKDETEVTIILQSELMATGEFGERMEKRYTVEVDKTIETAIGDTFSVENEPAGSGSTIWKTTQLLADDGYMQKFTVIDVTP